MCEWIWCFRLHPIFPCARNYRLWIAIFPCARGMTIDATSSRVRVERLMLTRYVTNPNLAVKSSFIAPALSPLYQNRGSIYYHGPRIPMSNKFQTYWIYRKNFSRGAGKSRV